MKYLLTLILFLKSISTFSQFGWIQQNGLTTATLYSVYFINNQTGWCVGDSGKIIKTTNSGLNWFSQTLSSSKNLRCITFSTLNTGFMVGDSGATFMSTNNGINWNDISFQTESLNNIFFVNDSVGYTGGIKLYKTINGGTNWNEIGSSTISYTRTINFIDELTGWIAGGVIGTINEALVKTTNGGESWSRQSPGGGVPSLIRSVFFIDSLNGWVGSPYSNGFIPTVYRSTNGGINWTETATGGVSNAIFFTSINQGWCVGESGHIFHTSNAGLSWSNQVPFNQTQINYSVYFTDSLTGWCVGDSGRILKTTTGGLTYIGNLGTEIPDEYFLSQNYPNPFNPTTVINYELRAVSFASLKIYDVLGNEVATLVNEKKSAGTYEVEFDGSHISSGIYFYRLEVDGDIIDTKRMVLLK